MADITFFRTVDPVDEPVTLQEARDQCRLDDDVEDGLISEYIAAARDYAERVTGLPLMPQTYVMRADCFSCEMPLKPNLIEVESVKYIDTNGDQQTVSPFNYVVETNSVIGTIYPDYGEQWPSTRHQKKAVEVTFKCGFASRAKVPDTIKSAMKLLINHWHENRSAATAGAMTDIPYGVDMLLGVNKLWRV